jgi:diguanylate cyclase (GGDEF)-like protein
LGAGVAVLVLTLHPADEQSLYTSVPAALMLLAVSARLLFALHDVKRTRSALERSLTDELTGLPNRRALRERIDSAIARGTGFALAFLDLDGFKDINDTLGHLAGDEVLAHVGRRLRHAIPAFTTVARLGGDEFGILVPNGEQGVIESAASAVLDSLGEPLRVEGIDVTLSASVGVVEWAPANPVDTTELLRRADVAMYRGKGLRNCVVRYEPAYDDFSVTRLCAAEELRRGIGKGELEVWYQPQIDASTLRPCALEALVRWRHPTEGVLSPVAFLPAARRAGLMPVLSHEVVRLAVADAAHWRSLGLDLRVSVNCAPPELLSGLLMPQLHEAIAAANLPADSFVLEVTEDSFIADPEQARELLLDIRHRGVQIAIDDYGTGFSSLRYLRDLPVDELKLDRSFVSAIGSDERSRMIVASTVQMATALGLRTVAEGVEDAATAAELIAMGVTALQGYYLSRPMQPADVAPWLESWPMLADLNLSAPVPSPRAPAG